MLRLIEKDSQGLREQEIHEETIKIYSQILSQIDENETKFMLEKVIQKKWKIIKNGARKGAKTIKN